MKNVKYSNEVYNYLNARNENIYVSANGRLILLFKTPDQSFGWPIYRESIDITDWSITDAMLYYDDDNIDPFTGKIN